MPRPEIKFVAEMTPETKRRLMSAVGSLTGTYEVEIAPKRNSKSNLQCAYFFAVVVKAFHTFLRDQEWDCGSTEAVAGYLKAKFLHEELVNPQTGEIIGRRIKGIRELDTLEMSDFTERCRGWLQEFFQIQTPDPDPTWREGALQARRIDRSEEMPTRSLQQSA